MYQSVDPYRHSDFYHRWHNRIQMQNGVATLHQRYNQYPDVDTFSHGTFNESSVDKVLSKYFTLNEEEEKTLKAKQDRKTSLVYKQNKENVIKLSESSEQLDTALDYIRENPRVKLMGRSNKGNLIFKEGINEVKITRNGNIL